MNENHGVRRGFVPSDEKEFNEETVKKLCEAQRDLYFLLNRKYPIKSAGVFVGNHYLLSERQRIAVVRATSSRTSLDLRERKLVTESIEGETVYIDGFNIIITLEVALSGSTLIKCMDGTIRDLAGLRGTYKLIDKTDMALKALGDKFQDMKIGRAVFYLDKPVSNSGRLKMRILELLNKYNFEVEVELVDNADKVLEKLENVISSDAIVIDRSRSWINLSKGIVDKHGEGNNAINLSFCRSHVEEK